VRDPLFLIQSIPGFRKPVLGSLATSPGIHSGP
jgi:hypothetical protein